MKFTYRDEQGFCKSVVLCILEMVNKFEWQRRLDQYRLRLQLAMISFLVLCSFFNILYMLCRRRLYSCGSTVARRGCETVGNAIITFFVYTTYSRFADSRTVPVLLTDIHTHPALRNALQIEHFDARYRVAENIIAQTVAVQLAEALCLLLCY